ncbi:type II toxin-antitoxin system Phd/YefM family antitoxin [Roseicella aquatilis]|uniref:Antitoxin n=2 Tax=Roseicella aquatilis TaxID=2527868 RepID=A0A4R4DAG5_9PROT|nr:type II toxin-antitoxin system Phd/YefM family antitoxin [Roseicella aquatilis]
MRQDVSVAEAKARLSALLDAVEAGEEVTITRHGRPVARLVGPRPPRRAGGELAVDPAWRDFRPDPALFAPMTEEEARAEGWPG